jgi:NlpC/P60 family putative phage cell wall peptidase
MIEYNALAERPPLSDAQRQAVLTEARSWVGTRYHHCADVKGAGVDCGMLLVRVYTDCGIAPYFDPRPYAPQWFLHQTEEIYLKWIQKYCMPTDNPGPADIAMYRFGRCAAHGAIIVDDTYMIHAFQPDGQVSFTERRQPLPHGKLESFWSPRVMAS